MSVLTKLFTVLLVICSLTLSAAVVVFVNRVEDYKKSYESNVDQIKINKKTIDQLQVDLVNAANAKQAALKSAADREAELDRKIADLNTRLGEKDATIAGLNKDKDVAAAANMGTVNALTASEKQNADLQKIVAETRKNYDDIVKKSSELNGAITVADNKNRALLKQLEYSEEVISDLQNKVKTLTDKGPVTRGGGSSTPMADSVPDIKGVVREVNMISGKKYATISVGSSSAVTKGMRFTVINRQTGDFLGYVTIDNVQPDEAIGQIEGPKIDKVQPGVDVRTQL